MTKQDAPTTTDADIETFLTWARKETVLDLSRKGARFFEATTRQRFELWQAARASSAAAQWLPIVGAPKDGSEILLGRAESEELDSPGISVPGYWQEGYEDGVDYMGCDSGFVDSHHQTFGGGRSFGAESHRYAPNQPTHWMPLPAPPAKPADTAPKETQ